MGDADARRRGTTFTMTGTADADLYVRIGAAPSTTKLRLPPVQVGQQRGVRGHAGRARPLTSWSAAYAAELDLRARRQTRSDASVPPTNPARTRLREVGAPASSPPPRPSSGGHALTSPPLLQHPQRQPVAQVAQVRRRHQGR